MVCNRWADEYVSLAEDNEGNAELCQPALQARRN